MLEDPVTSSGKQDDCGSIFSADTSDPLHARYCTLWNERYYYIPWTSEHSKYSNTSNTKSRLEMHINIRGGLTPNWEQGGGKWKPGSDLASQGHPSWDLCHECTDIVLPVYLPWCFIFSPLAYLTNVPPSWQDRIMFAGLLAEQVFYRDS